MPRSNLIRLVAVGLSACALAPATAAAVPAVDGAHVVTKSVHHAVPATGGDVVSGGGYSIPAGGAAVTPQPPNFPTNTKALAVPAAKSSDDGIDTGVVIALGAAALLAIGGLGLVMASRPRATRRRQPA